MANTIPNPVILPDPLAANLGLPILATDYRYLFGSMNVGLSAMGAGVVVQQQFEDGVLTHSGATPEDAGLDPIPVARWLITAPSTQHTAVTVTIIGSSTVVDHEATVIVEAVNADHSDNTELPLGGGEVTLELEIDPDPVSGQEEIRLYLSTDGTGEGIVEYIMIEIDPIASPLPAATFDGLGYGDGFDGAPFGLGNAVVADAPLPANRGRQIIDTWAHLKRRSAVLFAWSDLDPSYSNVDATQQGIPDHGIEWRVPPVQVLGWLRDRLLTRLYVGGDGVADRRYETPWSSPVTVEDDADPAWVSRLTVGPPRGGLRDWRVTRDGGQLADEVRSISVWMRWV